MRLCGRRSGSAALRHAVATPISVKRNSGSAGFFSIFRRMLAMFTRRIWLSPLARGPHSSMMMNHTSEPCSVFAQQGPRCGLAEGEVDILTADTDLVLM